ncbi:transglutaminase family protein [Bifidobacterium polysaccharolyticum]|uniref:transglutaminase family protein n=1 Tax=Bifidobacterium polysaccharolyticum TaxID=2750967 RepID=UPI00061F4997|nr:Transglutaminase-like enzyme, putative cysteine protease [Bifidobacterium asteroides]
MSTSSASWMEQAQREPIRLINRTGLQSTVDPTWRRSPIILVAALAPLDLMAGLQLLPVYGSLSLWLTVGAAACLTGLLIAMLPHRSIATALLQPLLLIASQFLLGPIFALNGTTLTHVLPTWATLTQGWSATFGAFKTLAAIDPPLGQEAGGLMALWTLMLWTCYLAVLLARHGLGRNLGRPAHPAAVLAATLPILATMIVSAALGTSRGLYPALTGGILWLLLLIWSASGLGLLRLQGLPSTLLTLTLAAGMIFSAGILPAPTRQVIRDHYQPPMDPYQFTSPLSDYRAYIKRHRDDTLVTVRNLPAGTPVRMAVMDRYDGKVWNLSDSSGAGAADYRRVGAQIRTERQQEKTKDGEQTGRPFTATFLIREGFDHAWLPSAGQVDGIDPDQDLQRKDLYFNKATDTALTDQALQAGASYTVHGVAQNRPATRRIADSDPGDAQVPPLSDAPESLPKAAASMTSMQVRGGARALAIEERLHKEGWFSHGLAGDYPSPSGHGDYRINQLLQGQAMVGDSEQYASAMALLARQMGLPSRVVLGFLPKNHDGSISRARTRTQADGSTRVDLTGRDAQAWVEVNLKGLGWIPFYPTPPETKTPDKSLDPTPPDPHTLVRQPPPPLADPPHDDHTTQGRTTVGGQEASPQSPPSFWKQHGPLITKATLWTMPVWLPALPILLLLGIKTRLRRRARSTGDPKTRIRAGWRQIGNLGRQTGLSLDGTRSEQAALIAQTLLTDPPGSSSAGLRGDLDRLRSMADQASFDRHPSDEQEAEDCWQLVDKLRSAILTSLPRTRRWCTLLSPRHLH